MIRGGNEKPQTRIKARPEQLSFILSQTPAWSKGTQEGWQKKADLGAKKIILI
jgi:hypothetical protein